MDIIILAIIVIILNLLFWGAIFYFIVKFFRSKSTGLSNQQKIDIVTKGMEAYSTLSRGKGSKSLMDSKMGGVAASAGIDLDNK
jgi:hypothetical protein